MSKTSGRRSFPSFRVNDDCLLYSSPLTGSCSGKRTFRSISDLATRGSERADYESRFWTLRHYPGRQLPFEDATSWACWAKFTESLLGGIQRNEVQHFQMSEACRAFRCTNGCRTGAKSTTIRDLMNGWSQPRESIIWSPRTAKDTLSISSFSFLYSFFLECLQSVHCSTLVKLEGNPSMTFYVLRSTLYALRSTL